MQPTLETSTRRYDIDAIRVLAFALLILYHVGMFYVADWGWHIKSRYQSDTLQLLMLLVNQWRMPLLFLISGTATWFMFRKSGAAEFARSRLVRLLLPLAFGMLVVVPPQAYLEALTNGATQLGYPAFLKQYFTFQPWPDGAFPGSDFAGITWNHLWYLPYLLCYTLALIPAAIWLRQREATLQRLLSSVNGYGLIALPVLPMLVYGFTLFPRFGGSNHALLDDWYGHAQFFTFFVYGYLLAGNTALWRTLGKLRGPLLWLAPACFAVFLALERLSPEDLSPVQQLGYGTAVYLNRWCWILAVLAWAHHCLNRPFRWLPYANEAVYPWYILHQTITVIAGYQLARWSLGPVLEPILVLIATIAGCLLLHEFLIRRFAILRPLFGLKPLPAGAAVSGRKRIVLN
ncbi:acyltransferase family protein [Microbulbifer sp.]|uniref:acyltransferase family protein n=1 Tax=Microbulbifer sp. TaxID=1908541 RepID=UPI003F385137